MAERLILPIRGDSPAHSTLHLVETYAAVHPDEPCLDVLARCYRRGADSPRAIPRALIVEPGEAFAVVEALNLLSNVEDDADRATGDPSARAASRSLSLLSQRVASRRGELDRIPASHPPAMERDDSNLTS